ncbi:hypothetical protein RhiJN_09271 [Ceratobasidium sp. AG-Ba]|nr:hypothetical protein RhiJN_09271 [Ceratobasidium sp. AG-Ba]
MSARDLRGIWLSIRLAGPQAYGAQLGSMSGAQGQLSTTRVSGIPIISKPLLFVVKPKLEGTAGRGPGEGYNLQVELGMSDVDYGHFKDLGRLILHRTHMIDLTKSIDNQPVKGIIEHVINKFVAIRKEFEVFREHKFWCIKALYLVLLRYRSRAATTKANKQKALEDLAASGGPLPPLVKPRKKPGRPPKNGVPTSKTKGRAKAAAAATSAMPGPREHGPIVTLPHPLASSALLAVAGPPTSQYGEVIPGAPVHGHFAPGTGVPAPYPGHIPYGVPTHTQVAPAAGLFGPYPSHIAPGGPAYHAFTPGPDAQASYASQLCAKQVSYAAPTNAQIPSPPSASAYYPSHTFAGASAYYPNHSITGVSPHNQVASAPSVPAPNAGQADAGTSAHDQVASAPSAPAPDLGQAVAGASAHDQFAHAPGASASRSNDGFSNAPMYDHTPAEPVAPTPSSDQSALSPPASNQVPTAPSPPVDRSASSAPDPNTNSLTSAAQVLDGPTAGGGIVLERHPMEADIGGVGFEAEREFDVSMRAAEYSMHMMSIRMDNEDDDDGDFDIHPDPAPNFLIWRGLKIPLVEVAKIRNAAAIEAAGGNARFGPIYKDLIKRFIEDPDYDPASEPNPPPRPEPKASRGRGRRAARGARSETTLPDGAASTTLNNTPALADNAPTSTGDSITVPVDAQPVAQKSRAKPKMRPAPVLEPKSDSETEPAADQEDQQVGPVVPEKELDDSVGKKGGKKPRTKPAGKGKDKVVDVPLRQSSRRK